MSLLEWRTVNGGRAHASTCGRFRIERTGRGAPSRWRLVDFATGWRRGCPSVASGQALARSVLIHGY